PRSDIYGVIERLMDDGPSRAGLADPLGLAGTAEEGNEQRGHAGLGRVGPGKVYLLEEKILLDIRQQTSLRRPASASSSDGKIARGGKTLQGVEMIVQGQPDLLEVVLTFRSCSGFAHFLNGRQEQADQDGYDADDHQQLD